jgi:hypothetical protein
MERAGDRKKMEGYCSTGQSPQWALVPMEEEEEEKEVLSSPSFCNSYYFISIFLFR